MICWLKGVPRLVEGLTVILDVNGVGYQVLCPLHTLTVVDQYRGSAEAVELYIDSITREDGTILYGFATLDERNWFRALMTVHAVGGKLALSSLGVLGVDGLIAAVRNEDIRALCAAPGVGRKVAERILTELRAKATLPGEDRARCGGDLSTRVEQDAAAHTLAQLGFGAGEVKRSIDAAVAAGARSAEDIVRAAIQTCGRAA